MPVIVEVQVIQDRLAMQAIRDLQVPLVQLDLLDLLVTEDKWEQLVQVGLQALKGSQAIEDNLASQVILGQLVTKDSQALLDRMAPKGSQVIVDPKEQLALRVSQVLKAREVHQVHKGLVVMLEYKAPVGRKVTLVNQVMQEVPVLLVDLET